MTSSPIPRIERPAYFDGQRLGADDLTAAADYTRALRQLHNRALHGWGVVTGLGASGARGERSVRVEAGLALDCAGRELLLPAARDVSVPPVSEESHWFLTISGVPEDQLGPGEDRPGACGSEGAVRLVDTPFVGWLSASGKNGAALRQGLDVILGEVTLANCKLGDDVDLDARQELAREQPYVAAGSTEADATAWTKWPASGKQLGVMTTVSTAEAGFRATPSYQARLAGTRQKNNIVFDGPAHVEAADASSFILCVDLRPASATTVSRAKSEVLRELGWRVVWMGVELQ
jgi:hypothetical protein